MSLTSASTLAQIKAAYDDNLDYDLAADVTKARDIIQAARMLLRRMAEEIQNGGEHVRDDYHKIEAQLNKAEAWWRANDTDAAASGITHRQSGSFRRLLATGSH